MQAEEFFQQANILRKLTGCGQIVGAVFEGKHPFYRLDGTVFCEHFAQFLDELLPGRASLIV